MATAAIEATATISAATVAAVRRWLRVAFSAPNRTVIPKGRPMRRSGPASPPTTSGSPTTRATRHSPAPATTRPPWAVEIPPSTSAAPPTATATATAARARGRDGATIPSCSVRSGGVRPARNAPGSDAATATAVPITTANASVAHRGASPGGSRSLLASQASRPAAAPTPTATPTRDATAPTTAASDTTSRPSCRGVTPTTRSSPNSRARSAASIDRVLKMRNEPTASARTPKPRRTPATVPRKSLTPALSSWTARRGSTTSNRSATSPASGPGVGASGAARMSTEL